MTVGDRLRQIRASLGLNQPEMAAKMCVKPRAYQGYEANERLPQAESLQAIGHMGFNIYWLLSGEGEMNGPYAGTPSELPTVTLDIEFNAQILEEVTNTYTECRAKISPRDLGRVVAEVHNEISNAGLKGWDEKVGALRVIVGQLRRKLMAAPESNQGTSKLTA